MLPFANNVPSKQVTVGGKAYTLRPLTGEAGIDWVKATVEDGRIMAAALRDVEISEETLRKLFMRGYERSAQALGVDLLTAAELGEEERRLVIQTQDELQQTHIVEPYLNIEQAAARAYLGMGK